MPTLSLELYDRCRKIFLRCEEFESDRSLAAVFVVTGLAPLRSLLKNTGSPMERVGLCIEMLVKRSSEHHLPLLVFSRTLRGRYEPEDGLHNELTALCEDLSIALTGTLAFSDNSPLQEERMSHQENSTSISTFNNYGIVNTGGNTNIPPAPSHHQSGQPGLREEPSLNEIYVERSQFQECCQSLLEDRLPLLRIRSPRRMGKTNLMRRVRQYVRSESGWKTVALDFHLTGNDLANLDSLLKWICKEVSAKLDLPNQIDSYWGKIGYMSDTTKYFEEYVLPQISTDLVLTLDNVDLVFYRPKAVAEEFCSLLRGWIEQAKDQPSAFEKLHILVAHSTEEYGSFNIRKSPLNGVGTQITLKGFETQEIHRLAELYGLVLTEGQFWKIDIFLGGHPDLLNRAFKYLSRSPRSLLDEKINELFTNSHQGNGIFIEHLERYLEELEQNPDLRQAFRTLLASSQSTRMGRPEKFQLQCMGLISVEGQEVKIYCELYRIYFSEIWE